MAPLSASKAKVRIRPMPRGEAAVPAARARPRRRRRELDERLMSFFARFPLARFLALPRFACLISVTLSAACPASSSVWRRRYVSSFCLARCSLWMECGLTSTPTCSAPALPRSLATLGCSFPRPLRAPPRRARARRRRRPPSRRPRPRLPAGPPTSRPRTFRPRSRWPS
jgi:hypothetical protein